MLPDKIVSFLLSLPSFESLDPNIIRALLIIGLAFFLLLAVGLSHRFVVHTELRGISFGILIGMVALIAIEIAAVWIYRNYIIGDQSALLPRNVQVVIDDGRQAVSQVLGVATREDQPQARDVVMKYKRLSPIDAELVQNLICKKEK
jgi:hypothetical protein